MANLDKDFRHKLRSVLDQIEIEKAFSMAAAMYNYIREGIFTFLDGHCMGGDMSTYSELNPCKYICYDFFT